MLSSSFIFDFFNSYCNEELDQRDSEEDNVGIQRLGGCYSFAYIMSSTEVRIFVQETRRHAVKSNKTRKQLGCCSAVLCLFSDPVYSHKPDPV